MTLDQAQSPSHIAPGTIFDGRYWVVSYLGAGGMAHVYKVRHSHLDQILALKLLRREMCNDQRRVRRFKQEATAASSLTHPNLVNVQGFGIADGTPYLVMEYVEGDGLDAILDAEGPMVFSRVISIGKQIASALGFLHQHQIVHRDIKPANIIGTADGVYKVVDFGIAKVEELEDSTEFSASQSLTRTGAVVGTPTYMSPEQSMGQKVDRRSDIYSLGCLLFELATGKPPYEAASHYTMLAQHLKAKVPSLTGSPVNFEHEALDAVLKKCMAKSPADRYQTMEELTSALNACESEQPRSTHNRQPGRLRWLKAPAFPRSVLNGVMLCMAMALTVSIPFVALLPQPQANNPADCFENFSVQQLGDEAVAKLSKNNYPEALNLLLAAQARLEANPHCDQFQRADVQYHLAWVLKSMGEPGAAIPHFMEAAKVYSRKGSLREKQLLCTYFQMGVCYSWCGKWRQGADLMERALASGPCGSDQLLPLGETYLRLNRLSEIAGSRYPWEDGSLPVRSVGGKRNGQPWGALGVFLEIEKQAPARQRPYVCDLIAATLTKLRRYEEAEKWAIAISEKESSLRWLTTHRLARIRLATGDLPAAEKLIAQLIANPAAMKDSGVNASEHFDMGIIHYHQGDFAAAEKDFQQAYLMLTKMQVDRPDAASVKANFDMILCARRARDLARDLSRVTPAPSTTRSPSKATSGSTR